MSAYDVIIVGSGAGGAPVALRCAEAGKRTLLIERGPRYDRKQFDRDEIEWCRRDAFIPALRTDPHMRRSDTGARAFPTSDGWISTVLGGGTIHMGGYFLRAHEDDTKLASRTKGVAGSSAIDWAAPFAEIEKEYAEAERILGVSGVEATKMAPVIAHPFSAAIDSAAKKNGLPSVPTPRAILTEGRPDEDRSACAYHAQCGSYGCPNDAKSSTTVSFIRRAEKTGVLTVWTDARATRLAMAPGGKRAEGVWVKRRGKDGVLKDEKVTAKVVVVACGAIESARLLLLTGDVGEAGEQIGKNLWFSLFTEATGFVPKSKDASVMGGSPFLNRTVVPGGVLDAERQKTFGIDRAGTLQFSFVHDNPIHRAERVATETGKGVLWGKDLKRALERYFLEGRGVRVEGFGESMPHPGASVDLDTRRDALGLKAARITYFHHPRDQAVAKAMRTLSAQLLKDAGCDDVKKIARLGQTWVLQGGTCRMGTSPKESVVDKSGKVWGTDNVFVTDGGAIPSSTTVPISLTIVANALRCAPFVIGAAS